MGEENASDVSLDFDFCVFFCWFDDDGAASETQAGGEGACG
jgi:hypothetical protein